MCDFIFEDGVQVVSAFKKRELESSQKEPNLPPYLQTFEGQGNNGIKREVVCTNQEGKLYYVACYKYFIDLADLDNEFQANGHFEHYKS
jgi:hypothetical protein